MTPFENESKIEYSSILNFSKMSIKNLKSLKNQKNF